MELKERAKLRFFVRCGTLDSENPIEKFRDGPCDGREQVHEKQDQRCRLCSDDQSVSCTNYVQVDISLVLRSQDKSESRPACGMILDTGVGVAVS